MVGKKNSCGPACSKGKPEQVGHPLRCLWSQLLEWHELSLDALAVFNEMRALRKTDYINNIWR
jgi:hypothetical protein